MSKGLKALRKIEIHLDYLDETYNVNYGEEFDIIEKELEMTQIVKRLFKDANLRDYDHFEPCDKKLVSREEWNNFLKWLKEKDND